MKITATDQQIISFIESWVRLLALGDYEEAFSGVSHDPYYNWSPALMESVVNGYGLPEPHPSGEVFKVTDPDAASGVKGNRGVVRSTGSGHLLGHAYYELPLNGEWSDLTTSFRLERCGEDITFVLEEIHVM